MLTFLRAIFSTIIVFMITFAASAQKTDKVFLKNGDVITGEMKSMKLAKLSFDMNGPGIISIKWEEIVRISSIKTFQVTLQNGRILLVSLDSLFFDSQQVRLDDIVEIVQMKNRFLKRLEGNLNLGFNYNKSSDIVQFNFNSSTTYRKPKTETNFKLNTVNSRSSKDSITSKKQDATLGFLKKLNRMYYLMTNVGWERNTELGLSNRFLLTAGGGKIIVNDNHHRLLTGVGFSYNNEQFNTDAEYQRSVEALAIIQFKKFRYSSPKVNIDAQYVIYPGLSDWGRIRMTLQINTSVELFKDFLVGLNFYDNYDNRPSSEAASNNDYGIAFTIGYQFGQ